MSKIASPLSHNSGRRVNGAVPVAHHYALAGELAAPVDAGNLTQSEAMAALLVAALAAERGGRGYAPAIFSLQRHLFAQRLEWLTVQRQIAEGYARLQEWRQRHGR